jgi:hypothetical protein
VLVAQIFSDTGQRVVNWAAGNVVLPTPDQDQSITWNANTQQLGRGANKIQLDGGTGNVDSPRHALGHRVNNLRFSQQHLVAGRHCGHRHYHDGRR